MLRREPLPLVILGGRDRQPAELPEGTTAHILSGYKGMNLQIGGEPLIAAVVRRYRSSGAFDPIWVAGPREIYGEAVAGAEVIDTDGHLAANLRATLHHLWNAGFSGALAFSSCDVLPEVDELHILLEDYHAHAPSDYWMPQIRVPEDPSLLGASQYKPRYGLKTSRSSEPVDVLPGHLVIMRPEGFRYELLFAYFEAVYVTRSTPLRRRVVIMGLRLLFYMLRKDFKTLLTGGGPGMTYECGRHGYAIARRLPREELTFEQLAYLVSRCFVRRSQRRQHPSWRGRMPLFDALSLAKDIDTEEEAQEAQEALGNLSTPGAEKP
ncbi:MAG: hypothetical protein AAGD01_15210 [Acidobacteriota bacterium]